MLLLVGISNVLAVQHLGQQLLLLRRYINKLDLDLYGPLALTKVQEANCWVHSTAMYFVTSQSTEGEFQINQMQLYSK